MKTRIIKVHGTGERYGIEFHCPGCGFSHAIPVMPYKGGWDFNEDLERPTVAPSILVHEVRRKDETTFSPRCHSFLRDGRLEFLGDCGHALAGQTVDLPELPEETSIT